MGIRLPTIQAVSPERRLRFANQLFWWSLIATVPALLLTWFLPKIGIMILQFVSFGALWFTAYDILATSDARNELENNNDS